MKATFQSRMMLGVTVVDISGRLTLGEPIAMLQEEIAKASEQSAGKVILNLAQVDYLDSAGLGELVRAAKLHTVKLVSLPKRIEDLLHLTGSWSIFDVQPDEPTAIRSFQ